MSRENKFRAWDGKIMTTSGIQFISTGGLLEFKPDGVLMQYTGLKDRNGKEIYEGDIVKHFWGGRVQVVEWNKYDAGFNVSTSYIDDGGGDCAPETVKNIYEIIGNVYENPELLEANHANR